MSNTFLFESALLALLKAFVILSKYVASFVTGSVNHIFGAMKNAKKKLGIHTILIVNRLLRYIFFMTGMFIDIDIFIIDYDIVDHMLFKDFV
jgi:hypothetical protein